jgi:lysophospholipase L1-like esterase
MFRWLALLLCFSFVLGLTRADDAKKDDKKEEKKETKKSDKKPAPKVDANKPIERLAQEFWKKRHEKFVEIAKKGEAKLVFLGDSITQGWEGNGKKAWADTFAPMKAANLGIGGDQTGHVLWRITEGKELGGLDPKAFVIMIGTNNMGAHSAEGIASGVEAIVKELREKKPSAKILLLAIFPRSGAKIDKEEKMATAKQLQPKVAATNKLIEKLADGKNVIYKDIGAKFLDKDGNLPKEIMPDYLHLSPKGYEVWADAIKADVESLMK